MAYEAVPPVSPLRGVTGVINGGTNSATLANAVTRANAAGGGQTIVLGKGTYRLTSAQTISANGISIVGNGPGSTFIELDDSGGLSGGDAFTVSSVLQFAIKGLSFTATTARTAGSFLTIKGQNNITATPAQKTRQYTVEDVDAEDQFNGVSIVNGDDGDGAWGGFINRCEWIRFSAGGTYVDINSPAGGQHYISNLKMYGSHSLSDANRALAGVRYRGGADLEMCNVNQIYMRSGLLIDPPNGQAANVTVATACLWDNNTQASVKVTPAAGGTVLGIKLNGGWGYTPAANSLPCIQLDGGSGIGVYGMELWSNYQAIRLGAIAHATITGNDCSGSAAGIYGTAVGGTSPRDFVIQNNVVGIRGGVTPTVGIQIDAGADHYSITHNVLREATTPITNTPGTSANRRIVQDNVTL